MSVSSLDVVVHLKKMHQVNSELIETMRGLLTVKNHVADPGDALLISDEIRRLAKASERMTLTINSLAETVIGSGHVAR